MNDPLAARNAAGVSIWLNDLSREGLVPKDSLWANDAKQRAPWPASREPALTTAHLQRELRTRVPPFSKPPGKHFASSCLSGFHRLWRKQPEAD